MNSMKKYTFKLSEDNFLWSSLKFSQCRRLLEGLFKNGEKHNCTCLIIKTIIRLCSELLADFSPKGRGEKYYKPNSPFYEPFVSFVCPTGRVRREYIENIRPDHVPLLHPTSVIQNNECQGRLFRSALARG